MSGYSYIIPETQQEVDGFNLTVAGYEGVFVLQDTQNPHDILKLWNPILDHINSTWPGWLAYPTVLEYPSFKAWYDLYQDADNEAGTDILVGSRLLDEKALTASTDKSIPNWKQFTIVGGGTAYLVSGKGVRDAKIAGGSNAVNPAWRKAYVHASKSLRFHGCMKSRLESLTRSSQRHQLGSSKRNSEARIHRDPDILG